jgi:hypothetical protein
MMAPIRQLSDIATTLDLEATFTQNETTTVLDWDDTLICSTWFKVKGFNLKDPVNTLTSEMSEACVLLSVAVSKLLEKAKEFGQVIIITNAMASWVTFSCKFFIPAVFPLILGIPIISAQDTYKKYSVDPIMWKRYAFFEQVNVAFKRTPGLRRNIISIGDGLAEQEAMRSLYLEYAIEPTKRTFTKSVKMMEQSGPEGLIKQLELITYGFSSLALRQEDLELLCVI